MNETYVMTDNIPSVCFLSREVSADGPFWQVDTPYMCAASTPCFTNCTELPVTTTTSCMYLSYDFFVVWELVSWDNGDPHWTDIKQVKQGGRIDYKHTISTII